ncbi:hypothetical protein NEOC95_001455 [Neochlamydia sp. AcF95]|nr:hypothetical protein [Neochlamydia sp. AcF95]
MQFKVKAIFFYFFKKIPLFLPSALNSIITTFSSPLALFPLIN